MHFRFVKNALANLGRGTAAAVAAVLLPPILVRHMAPAAYAVWVLVLQTATYVSFLNFGLQTAIGRYVAFANEKGDTAQRDSVYSTAFAALCGAAAIAILCLFAVIFLVPGIFPGVPGPLISQMRLALLIVGIVTAIELPASAWNGVFIGLQRFDLPALTVGGARLTWAIGIAIAAIAGYPLVALAAVIACANLPSYLIQYCLLRRIAPYIRFKPSMINGSTARTLASYCFGLTVMSFSMLLISGFDLILVGHFQFSAVTPYSVAASLITLVSGLLFAGVNVIMPHAATLHATERSREMGALVVSSTRFSVFLLILTGIPVLIYAAPIIHLWIGQRYVAAGAPLLQVLIIANIVRLVGAPYSVILVAAGQHSYIKISPLAEALTNFLASVLLGHFYGGMGVALGTLIGSVIGVATHLCYSMVRTRNPIDFSRREFLLSGVALPLAYTSPLILVSILSLAGASVRPSVFGLAFAITFAIESFGVYRFLEISKRQRNALGAD